MVGMDTKVGYPMSDFASNRIGFRHSPHELSSDSQFEFIPVPIPVKPAASKAKNRKAIRFEHSKAALRIAAEIIKCTSRKNVLDNTVSLSCLPKVLSNLGVKASDDGISLASLITSLLDVEKTGKISVQALPLALDDILRQAKRMKVGEFGFKVFSGERQGQMSKKELTNMVSLYWNGSLDNIIGSPGAAMLFYKFLTNEVCGELLEFYLDVLFWNSKKRLSSQVLSTAEDRIKAMEDRTNRMPIEKVKKIVKLYINRDSEKQVNISDKQRNEILEEVKFSEMIGEDSVPVIIFRESILEVKSLMETDKTRRFAQEMKDSLSYAKFVWKKRYIKNKEYVTRREFNHLITRHSVYFKFLEKFHRQLFDLKVKTTEVVAKEEQRRTSREMMLGAEVQDYVVPPSLSSSDY